MDELELNRFRKQDGRVLLEQHDACEVPAGCGGVVLRWVRPGAPMTVSVRSFAHANVQAWIDGVELSYGRAELAPGSHVLGLTLSDVTRPEDAVLLAAIRAEHRRRPPIAPAPDRWQWRPSKPAEGWTAVEASDEGWHSAIEAEVPRPRKSFDQHSISSLLVDGAVPVGAGEAPPTRPGPVARISRWLSRDRAPTTFWFRLRFELEEAS